MNHVTRNDAVTHIPVLVYVIPAKRDGHIVQFSKADIPVRLLPVDDVKGLYRPESHAAIDAKYGGAFSAIPRRDRDKLLNLVLLAQAIQRRDYKALARYAQAMIPLATAKGKKYYSRLRAAL